MLRSRNSLILLSLLAFLVLFFSGFRLGALVEHRNKTYVAPTPIPTTEPTATPPPVGGPPKKFSFAACDVSFFLTPEYKLEKESTESATFVAGPTRVTALCGKQRQLDSKTVDSLKQATLTIGGKEQVIYRQSKTTDVWEIRKPGTSRFVLFTTPKSLTELIARTVVFETIPLLVSPTP